jgi:thymidylate synthase (FAD)
MNTFEQSVLNAGSVRLIGVLGGDIDIINAARVSFASSEDVMTDQSIGLINYLMKNKHATPFEHVVFKFHIKCPIFVAREWFRHRWSSFNEMSMRYHVPKKLDFFVSEQNHIRKQIGKPGAYSFERINDSDICDVYKQTVENVYNISEQAYNDLLAMGIAKELARTVLPVGQYTEFVWTVNLRSFFNFLSLRNSSDAQFEINEYARIIEEMVSKLIPVSYDAFLKNDRIAI